MRYISLFSGIGGLEHPSMAPSLWCEIDPACGSVLAKRFPESDSSQDVASLDPPAADVVAGGWPCQDISVAGLRKGLSGQRSGLFFEMMRVAKHAGAHSVVAENVPNLLTLEGGAAFATVLDAFSADGYPYVAWRTFNAREFGLPQQRRRVFIVASKDREIALRLHREHRSHPAKPRRRKESAGFYWTAGLQSICYSVGFVPTLKVGSTLSIPSPPAVEFGDCVRKISPHEALRFQGFDPTDFSESSPSDIYRMTGNAVPAPIGHWVFETFETGIRPKIQVSRMFTIGPNGFSDDGEIVEVAHVPAPMATNLSDFIDWTDKENFSERAASGLLARLRRSGKPCPERLLGKLVSVAGDPRSGDGIPTGTESLAQLDEDELAETLDKNQLALSLG